ncbi:DUF6657 family protein [Thermosulfurimonas dismutans]|uniref:Uncharacterized protein n=1 Tax=Thermosulfurimonas dismutans TaxID=999894 RepID=A0A179D4T6_9BACT|nr:DUF6657 family protein [Thermosulfurimonas dismutans]OAQ20983.1 hypothetical protein TDIS_0909 [Thermosulfurimonas dismutans]
MGEIKSALEIALEKAEKIGRASREELKLEELKEKGQRLAAKFLNSEEEIDLAAEIARLNPSEKGPFIKGIIFTLLRNINLPRDEYALEGAKKALLGLEIVFSAFPDVKQLTQEIERLLSQYLQHRKALYEQLKQQFESQLAGVEEALRNQMGVQVQVDVEMQPQFQEEWRKVRDQLDPQYERQLEYLKNIFAKALNQ